MTITKIATLTTALILCGWGASAATASPSLPQAQTIAQTAPEPAATSAPTDEGKPMPAETTEPAPAPAPVPQTNPAPVNPVPVEPQTNPLPVSPSNETIELKHGGLTGNSNGDNWIDKFNRNPGADTSNMPATIKIKTKVKAKKYPPSGM